MTRRFASHLAECAELLFSITLPACLGFAVISPHVANVILGADFREPAAQIMPIIAIAVIFQILTQQYLHASFLLSGRNSFYLINTASIIAANVILSYVLVGQYGTIGAAWARLGADVIGFVCALILSRFAFQVPLPLGRLALTMIAALAMALIGRRPRPKPANCRSHRLRRAGLRRVAGLRGAVLAVRHFPDPRAPENRLRDVPHQIRKHQHWIRSDEQANDLDPLHAVPCFVAPARLPRIRNRCSNCRMARRDRAC